MKSSIVNELGTSFAQNRHVFDTFSHDTSRSQEVIPLLSSIYEDFERGAVTLPNKKIEELAQLPDEALLYLMVEIRLMIEENGPFKFEERELGCLKAFFKALCVALENIAELTISEKLIKVLHKVTTDTATVDNEQIDEETSGNYRPREKVETLSLALDTVSEDGVTHLINLIEQGALTDMKIASRNDYLERFPYDPEKNETTLIVWLLKKRHKIDTINSDAVVASMNKIANKKYIIDPPFTEQQLFAIFEKAQFIDGFYKKEQLLVMNYGLWDIADLIKNDANRHISEIQRKLINQNAMKFFSTKKTSTTLPPVLSISRTTIPILKSHYEVDNRQLAAKLIERISVTNDKLTLKFPSSSDVKPLMDEAIESFNSKVKDLKNLSSDQKLFLIFQHIQKFLLIHPFIDANNRVFVNELANRLMLQHGFTFSVYFNPLVFYAHSLSEIVTSVKLAQANYLALHAANEGKVGHFVIKIGIDTQHKLAQVADMVSPLRLFLFKQRVLRHIKLVADDVKETKAAFFEKQHNPYQYIENDISKIEGFSDQNEINQYLESRIKFYNENHMGLIAERYQALLIAKPFDKNLLS